MSDANRLRIFSEALTLDAWQRPKDGVEGQFDIYADVSFQQVAMGSEPETPIRFKLALKNVVVRLIMPPTDDAVSIERLSVDRAQEGIGSQEQTITKKSASGHSYSGAAQIGAKVVGWIKGRGSKEEAQSEVVETRKQVFRMTVSGYTISNREARWRIRSADGGYLDQAPWNATIPRATVIDRKHGHRRPGMEAGGIVFQVECLRSDLEISEFEFKDQETNTRFATSVNRSAQYAAITQYIRTKLQENGLEARNIDDKFGTLTILNTLVEMPDV